MCQLGRDVEDIEDIPIGYRKSLDTAADGLQLEVIDTKT